jgi:hypothetical protein
MGNGIVSVSERELHVSELQERLMAEFGSRGEIKSHREYLCFKCDRVMVRVSPGTKENSTIVVGEIIGDQRTIVRYETNTFKIVDSVLTTIRDFLKYSRSTITETGLLNYLMAESAGYPRLKVIARNIESHSQIQLSLTPPLSDVMFIVGAAKVEISDNMTWVHNDGETVIEVQDLFSESPFVKFKLLKNGKSLKTEYARRLTALETLRTYVNEADLTFLSQTS